MESKLTEMDKLQRSDHDTLIRLEGKVDALTITVATWQSGLDTRMKEIEKQLDVNTQWIHDFKNAYKVVAFMAALVGSFMSAIITMLTLRTEIFK